MTVVQITCPNCGSPSIKKDGGDYCCNNCGRFFQVVNTPKREPKSKIVVNQQLKYGKTTVNLEQCKTVGSLTLSNVELTCNLYQVFRFHTFKQMKRGDTIIKADIYGYFFTNPITGKLNDVKFADGGFPSPNDVDNPLERECIRIINDNAVEDKSSISTNNPVTTPQIVSGEKLHQEVFDWLTNTFAVQKRYYVQPKGYDSGARDATLNFKKKDVLEFGSIGIFSVPLFHLTYSNPNSKKTFRRDYLGYSGELILDEIKCSKSRLLDSTCDDFPNNTCVVCGNLICDDHTKRCESCGVTICKDCAVSKGLIKKQYYCSKCG